jgi:hypothetical protein
VGGVAVDALPDSDIEAAIEISFEKEDSFLLKAEVLNLDAMANLAQVALALKNHPQWNKKYRVVNGTYSGTGCVMISTKEADTKVVINGTANALKKFDIGAVNAEARYENNKQLGLEVVGQSGVVGLQLFKLGWSGSPKLLGPAGEEVEVEQFTDWDADLEDDI